MSEDLKLAALQTAFSSVPKPNLIILEYLLSFLKDVAFHSEINKMGYAGLSILFAPNLIRPTVDTIETSLQTPKVNAVFQYVMENFNKIVVLDQTT